MKTLSLSQPLAKKAQVKDAALCHDCGLLFYWAYQMKHSGCPECNSLNWDSLRPEKTRQLAHCWNSHNDLLIACRAVLEWDDKHGDLCKWGSVRDAVVEAIEKTENDPCAP